MVDVFNEIISSCRSTESTFTLSYLGPEGTFSESALEGQFGKSVETVSYTHLTLPTKA